MEGVSYVSYLERLPLEVIEIISLYLSAQDIAACCATNSWMREVFGCNSIWRGRCDRQLAVYLERTPCKTTPHFRIPDDSNGTLSPISYWRQCFMRENHLWRNWRTKNYAFEKFESHTEKLEPMEFIFFGNDIIILRFRERFEFWNVKESPHVKAVEDIKLTKNHDYKTIVASDHDILLLRNKKLILVFKLDFLSKKSMLKHAFFYHEQMELKNVKWPHDVERIVSERLRNQSEFFKSFHVIRKNLILSISSENLVIHIWDYSTGIKVKVDSFPTEDTKGVRIKTSERFMFISVLNTGGSNCRILAYDLDSLSYTSFDLSVYKLYDFIVTDDFVGVCYKKPYRTPYNRSKLVRIFLSIYSRKSSQIVLEDQPIHNNCETIKSKFVFVDCDEIKFFSPNTLSVESFLLPDRQGKYFTVINDRFLLIGGFGNPGSICKVYEYDGKSFNETNFKIVLTDYFYSKVNSSFTKVCDGRYLKTLW